MPYSDNLEKLIKYIAENHRSISKLEFCKIAKSFGFRLYDAIIIFDEVYLPYKKK